MVNGRNLSSNLSDTMLPPPLPPLVPGEESRFLFILCVKVELVLYYYTRPLLVIRARRPRYDPLGIIIIATFFFFLLLSTSPLPPPPPPPRASYRRHRTGVTENPIIIFSPGPVAYNIIVLPRIFSSAVWNIIRNSLTPFTVRLLFIIRHAHPSASAGPRGSEIPWNFHELRRRTITVTVNRRYRPHSFPRDDRLSSISSVEFSPPLLTFASGGFPVGLSSATHMVRTGGVIVRDKTNVWPPPP